MTTTTITLRLVKSTDVSKTKLVNIELDNNSAVNKWLDRFVYELESGAMLKKEHLFMGNSSLTVEQMVAKINQTLDTIADWDFVANQSPDYPVTEQPDISVRLSVDDFVNGPNNEKMNLIHNYFPILSGPAHRTSNYMYAASPKIRANICRLNLEVHELHTLLQKNQSYSGMHLNISWQRAPKNLPALDNDFDSLFTKAVCFGDVLLGYPQVGKTHFEAFIEEDDELDEEHVEPIKLLSGDALLHLSSPIGKETIDRFDKWLVERGLDPDDTSLRLGFARLGRVVGITPDQVEYEIAGQYDDVDLITVTRNGVSQSYAYDYSRFDSDYDDIWLAHIDD